MLRRPVATLLPLLVTLTLGAQSLPPGLTLGPPVPVAELRQGVSFGDEVLAAVPDGDGFRVYYARGLTAIRTVRVGADGVTHFETDRPVFDVQPALDRYSFRAVSAGTRTMLFWRDAGAVRFSAAASDGSAADRDGVRILAPASRFEVRCNAVRCFVGTDDHATDQAVVVSPVTGAVTSRPDLPPAYLPLAADDGGFLVAGGATDFHVVRIANDGTRTFDTIVERGSRRRWVSGDFDGVEYAVVWWNEGTTPPDRGTYAAHVTLRGAVEPPRWLFDRDNNRDAYATGQLVWNGREHIYVHLLEAGISVIPELYGPATVNLLYLDPDLAPAGVARTLPSAPGGTSFFPAIAVNGGATYIGWTEGFGSFAHDKLVFHAVVARPDRTLIDGSALAIQPIAQQPEAIVSTGEVVVAVWSDVDAEHGMQFWFARLTRDGVRIDAQPRPLGEPALSGSVVASALGSDVLLVWKRLLQSGTAVRAAILHTADASLERIAIPLSGEQGVIAASTNGTSWLVVSGGNAVAIARSGLLLTPQPVSITNGRPARSPSIASDGHRYLVAWEDDAAYVAIVNADASIAVPAQRIHARVIDAAATFTGRDYLVASRDFSETHFISRISAGGGLLGTTMIRNTSGWTRLFPFGTGALLLFDEYSRTTAVRLTADGALVDTRPFQLPFALTYAQARFTSTPQRTILALRPLPVPSLAAAAMQELAANVAPLRRSASAP